MQFFTAKYTQKEDRHIQMGSCEANVESLKMTDGNKLAFLGFGLPDAGVLLSQLASTHLLLTHSPPLRACRIS